MNCIETTAGTKNAASGYGMVHVPIGRNARIRVSQHRMAFEQAWGITLRPDQVVRHSCDRPSCVNPMHLMVGTHADNRNDAKERGRTSNQNRRKTHCPQGHEYAEDNIYWGRDGTSRKCKICTKARAACQPRVEDQP
jgi:hypothetical protein